MPTKINCQCFRQQDCACMHHAAPKPWIGRPQCVLVTQPSDPRLRGCELQYPYQRPDGRPNFPASDLVRSTWAGYAGPVLKVPPNRG
jgi:hypothetical protein